MYANTGPAKFAKDTAQILWGSKTLVERSYARKLAPKDRKSLGASAWKELIPEKVSLILGALSLASLAAGHCFVFVPRMKMDSSSLSESSNDEDMRLDFGDDDDNPFSYDPPASPPREAPAAAAFVICRHVDPDAASEAEWPMLPDEDLCCGEIARMSPLLRDGCITRNALFNRLCLQRDQMEVHARIMEHFTPTEMETYDRNRLNAPPPMHVKSYQKIAAKVHDATMQAASDAMRDAAQAVRDAQPTGNPSAGSNRLDVCISYDGTWHKRGHTLHFGVGVAIELETGLVLDFSVQSEYCHGCELGPKEDDGHFKEWAETHKAACQNYEGSSNAMEAQAAATIFSRSIELHNMQYVTVLCDGDSKAFTHVSSLDLYDKDIHKEDCINHVARRMYAGLEKLKKTKKGLGGKGKLTNVVMKTLTNYYACTLKDNAPDVMKMQRAIFASMFHMYSTDEEPRHVGCPDGEDSWCHYNRHKALEAAGKPSAPRPHRLAFSKDVARELVPVYNRLSRKELLLRCSRMMTQNANESFNALIWKRCPKTEFASLRTVETAVALAVLEFNPRLKVLKGRSRRWALPQEATRRSMPTRRLWGRLWRPE
ncbi:hypothetical protein ISCGN_013186 [Ixodes scapularis]